MRAMGRGNLEIKLTSYLKQKWVNLNISGIEGELIELQSISVTLCRCYDGEGNYQFQGSAEVWRKVNLNDKYGQPYKFTGMVHISEKDNMPVLDVNDITFIKI